MSKAPKPEPFYALVKDYERWLADGAAGSCFTYVIGDLARLRFALERVEEIAERAWLDAGGWPTLDDFHTNLRVAREFKPREDRRVALVQRRLLEGHTEYIAQKLHKPPSGAAPLLPQHSDT